MSKFFAAMSQKICVRQYENMVIDVVEKYMFELYPTCKQQLKREIKDITIFNPKLPIELLSIEMPEHLDENNSLRIFIEGKVLIGDSRVFNLEIIYGSDIQEKSNG